MLVAEALLFVVCYCLLRYGLIVVNSVAFVFSLCIVVGLICCGFGLLLVCI